MEKYVFTGLIIALIMATVVSIYSSTDPDGLEWVSLTLEEKGEWSAEEKPVIDAPIAEYLVPGIESETLAGSIAGLMGVIFMFILVYGLGKVLGKKNDKK